MMWQEDTFYHAYVKEIQAQVLVMPYEGMELSFVVLLPDEGMDISKVSRRSVVFTAPNIFENNPVFILYPY